MLRRLLKGFCFQVNKFCEPGRRLSRPWSTALAVDVHRGESCCLWTLVCVVVCGEEAAGCEVVSPPAAALHAAALQLCFLRLISRCT